MPLNCTCTVINFHFDEDLKRDLEQMMSLKGFQPGEVGSLHRRGTVGLGPTLLHLLMASVGPYFPGRPRPQVLEVRGRHH